MAVNAAIASGIAPHRHAVHTTSSHRLSPLLPSCIAIFPHFPAGMQCIARRPSMINGGSSSTTRQNGSTALPGVGRITRVNAVRFTALLPAFRLTPSSFPSLSFTVMPVRVSLNRIKYTFAAPAHATANQGMHCAHTHTTQLPCPADRRRQGAAPACYPQEPRSQTRSSQSSTP